MSISKDVTDRTQIVLIVGMPGAGKTVQGQLLQERLGFVWVSTGHTLREMNDPRMDEKLASGHLVSDDFVCGIITGELVRLNRGDRVLLDGFPRTKEQSEWLVDFLKNRDDIWISLVISLELDEETAAERLGLRGRAEDNTEALANRMREFKKITGAMSVIRDRLDVKIEPVDASKTVDEIHDRIAELISESASDGSQKA